MAEATLSKRVASLFWNIAVNGNNCHVPIDFDLQLPSLIVTQIKSSYFFKGASSSDTSDLEPVSEKISVTENERRWLVTGIAFQKINSQIRLHVEKEMLEYSDQEFYVEACRRILRLWDKHHYEHIKSFDQFDLRAIWELLSDCDSPSYCLLQSTLEMWGIPGFMLTAINGTRLSLIRVFERWKSLWEQCVHFLLVSPYWQLRDSESGT